MITKRTLLPVALLLVGGLVYAHQASPAAPAPPAPALTPAPPAESRAAPSPALRQPASGLPAPALPLPSPNQPPGTPAPSSGVRPGVPVASFPIDPATGLPLTPDTAPRFDLQFDGGSPKDFIDVVSKARGKPINAIIPDELLSTQLPRMNLKQVSVVQLFEALEAASRKTVSYVVPGLRGFGGGSSWQQSQVSFGFRTKGPPTDDSIWTFYLDEPSPPPVDRTPNHVVRFYQLGPYLEAYKVDDITTAVETGWKMLGVDDKPRMNFHKETKLLIAVGDPARLQVIDDVLSNLAPGMSPRQAVPPSAPRSGRAPPSAPPPAPVPVAK